MCKKVLTRSSKKSKAKTRAQPTSSSPIVYTRDQHPVSRKLLSINALKVLNRLNSGGFDAYLVGGGVRDILLGLKPKDFDIATNATPEEIKGLFRNCRLIGRRFRLAHIVFGRDIIEVATFRGHHDTPADNAKDKPQKPASNQKKQDKASKQSEHGMLLRDNIYGTIDEDAERRDFTINALYYSAKDFKVYDFADGVNDVHDGNIKLIGDPETRYREDPVRMLRAIRFANKLSMTIDEPTRLPILELAPLMSNIPAARMFEEFNKLFTSGNAIANFNSLRDYNLFKFFFPAVDRMLNDNVEPKLADFINLAMTNTDYRINNNQRVAPAFLFAAQLWFPLQQQIANIKKGAQLSNQDAFFAGLSEVMGEQQQSISIPKRIQAVMKDIWILQDKLARREGKRAFKTLSHEKFRAGYDFLLLRAQIESKITGDEQNELATLAQWWTDFQVAQPEIQAQMIKNVAQFRQPKRKTSRAKKKPKAKASE